jgi:HAMP domain-containing protein
MELLLNLLWLGLALPAIWMWRRRPVLAARTGWLRRQQPFLLFACVLMLLFPVVSATDDLHAIRQEMEESTPSKRMVKAVNGEKSAATLVAQGNSSAVFAFVFSFSASREVCGRVGACSLVPLQKLDSRRYSGRSPPFSLLA